jgi:hypothetical protein
VIDLVIYKKDGKYTCTGGPRDSITFTGTGKNLNECIGSWFVQNRETVNFQFSTIEGDSFMSSTVYCKPRTKEELGPNELEALKNFEKKFKG